MEGQIRHCYFDACRLRSRGHEDSVATTSNDTLEMFRRKLGDGVRWINTRTPIPFGLSHAKSGVVADMDRDGRMDMMITNRSNPVNGPAVGMMSLPWMSIFFDCDHSRVSTHLVQSQPRTDNKTVVLIPVERQAICDSRTFRSLPIHLQHSYTGPGNLYPRDGDRTHSETPSFVRDYWCRNRC